MDELKTVIITGANSGLGFETAKKIAVDHSFRLVLACRNIQAGEEAKSKIIEETKNENIVVMKIDTSSLQSAREFVEEFNKTDYLLYGLINNAGISGMHSGQSPEGVEIVFATNYLGHFYITNKLLETHHIKKIFNVTSDMHNPPQGIKWRKCEKIFFSNNKDRKQYAYSKLGNIYFTYELQEKLEEEGLDTLVNAFNPGMMSTNFAGGPTPPERVEFVRKFMPHRLGDLDKSSTALASLMLDNELSKKGKYFDRSTNTIESSKLSYNVKNRKELWDYTVTFINSKI